jgi:hypothetical protein
LFLFSEIKGDELLDKVNKDLHIFEITWRNKTKQNQSIALLRINKAGIPPASLETSPIKNDL